MTGEAGERIWIEPNERIVKTPDYAAIPKVWGKPGRSVTVIPDDVVDQYDNMDDRGNVAPRVPAPTYRGGWTGESGSYVTPPVMVPDPLPGGRIPRVVPPIPWEIEDPAAAPKTDERRFTIGPWTPPDLSIGKLPWSGGPDLDLTPGPRTGLPWTDESGAIDVKPGPGLWKPPDIMEGASGTMGAFMPWAGFGAGAFETGKKVVAPIAAMGGIGGLLMIAMMFKNDR